MNNSEAGGRRVLEPVYTAGYVHLPSLRKNSNGCTALIRLSILSISWRRRWILRQRRLDVA